MTNVTTFCHRFAHVLLLSSSIACSASSSEEGTESVSSSGTASPGTSATAPSGAAGARASVQSPAAIGGREGAAGRSTSSQPAAAGASATASAMAGAAGGGGAQPAAASGGGAAGSSTAAAGSSAGVAGASASAAGASGGGAAGSGAQDLTTAAKGFNELFLDAPCDSAARAPLEQGATCNHPPMTQHIEKPVMFGGEPGKKYKVTLRIRGIWEPTNIMGGMHLDEKLPFTIGGMVAGGTGSSSDSVNYQQYYIDVAEPKQTYWLNDYQYVAHDIHKQDYEAAITIAGGSAVKVVMNDGNEREIANFPKEMFSDVPPYDKMPSLGQSLRLDVVKVEVAP